MKIVIISDTHGAHSYYEIPECDVLIHCGDHATTGTKSQTVEFNDWLGTIPLPIERKLVISGNHDKWTEKVTPQTRASVLTNCTYLLNTGVTIDGIKFWGSPYVPNLPFWAFHKTDQELEANWEHIPQDTDVLITHCPPWCVLDRAQGIYAVGCEHLKRKVEEIKPKIHCFGHIHEDAGELQGKYTHFINSACSVTEVRI